MKFKYKNFSLSPEKINKYTSGEFKLNLKKIDGSEEKKRNSEKYPIYNIENIINLANYNHDSELKQSTILYRENNQSGSSIINSPEIFVLKKAKSNNIHINRQDLVVNKSKINFNKKKNLAKFRIF